MRGGIGSLGYRFLYSVFVEENKNKATILQAENPLKIVSLPWIPTVSSKLRKSFKNASYKAVFKSIANLKTIPTLKNKSELPPLSQPGAYMINCNCDKRYVGETSLKMTTRICQHEKSIEDKKWDSSGV